MQGFPLFSILSNKSSNKAITRLASNHFTYIYDDVPATHMCALVGSRRLFENLSLNLIHTSVAHVAMSRSSVLAAGMATRVLNMGSAQFCLHGIKSGHLYKN